MISKLYLKNFKKFKEQTVDLSPFSVLMGENSSGKTTVLQAINLALLNFYQHGFITYDASGKPRIRSRGVGATSLAGIPLSDYRELFFGKLASGGRDSGASTAIISLTDELANNYRLQVTSLFRAFNLKCVSTDDDLENNPILQKKPPLYISGFVGLNNTEERVLPAALRDRLKTGRVSSVLRNLLYDIKRISPEKYDSLRKRLAADFDFHLGDVLFDEENDIAIRADYSEECEKRSLSLDFNASGSGFMQVLQILAPIYRFCPQESEIVLLDEPDAHLHANMQTTLADTLRHIQKELGIQIVISTHSTSIIRNAAPAEVIPISNFRVSCGPLTKHADVDSVIRENIDSYYIAKSVLSGKIAFFEDANLGFFEKCDELLGSKVFKGPNTIPIIKGVGKSSKVPYQIRPILKELTDVDVDVHFVRDGDSLCDGLRKELAEYAKTKDCKLHCLKFHESESYLLQPELIHSALSKKYPNSTPPTVEQIRDKSAVALKETISLAKYNFEDVVEEDLFQVGTLLEKADYRNQTFLKKQAKDVRNTAEQLTAFADLLPFGMGKQALGIVLKWLNDELYLNLSKKELIESFELRFVPDEIKSILNSLRSNEIRPAPDKVIASAAVTEAEDKVEAEVENMIFNFGQ